MKATILLKRLWTLVVGVLASPNSQIWVICLEANQSVVQCRNPSKRREASMENGGREEERAAEEDDSRAFLRFFVIKIFKNRDLRIWRRRRRGAGNKNWRQFHSVVDTCHRKHRVPVSFYFIDGITPTMISHLFYFKKF